MKKLNDLFQELGISKVRLAKYLGVSRQMVYNYLELDDINKWPKEKKILLYKLLDIWIISTPFSTSSLFHTGLLIRLIVSVLIISFESNMISVNEPELVTRLFFKDLSIVILLSMDKPPFLNFIFLSHLYNISPLQKIKGGKTPFFKQQQC